MRRWVPVVACAVVLSGCAVVERLQLGPEPSGRRAMVDLRWRRELARLTDLEAQPRFRGTPVYDASRGVLYAGSLDHGLYAIRASDGAVLWRFQTLGAVEGTPVLDDGALFVGSDDGALYALDADTGALQWRFPTAAEVVRAPIVSRDSVYLVNADDTVFAVNREGGRQRWRYRREPPGGITASGHAGIVRTGRRIYTGFSDGFVVALDEGDGSAVWEHDTSSDTENVEGANEAHRLIDVDTTPVLARGALYVASYTAGLYAFDPASGSVRWRLETLNDISALATDGEHLYASSATLGLLKVGPDDGQVVWARSLGSPALRQPVVHADLLLVPTGDQALWLVRRDNGTPILGLTRSGLDAPPLVTDGWLFFATNASVLHAYRFLRAQR